MNKRVPHNPETQKIARRIHDLTGMYIKHHKRMLKELPEKFERRKQKHLKAIEEFEKEIEELKQKPEWQEREKLIHRRVKS